MKYELFFHPEHDETQEEQDRASAQNRAYREGKEGAKLTDESMRYWYQLGQSAK